MPIDLTIAREYWEATTENLEFPELGDDPVAALLLIIDGAAADSRAALRRVPTFAGNAYAAIAVAEEPTAEQEAWAAEITGLIALASKALKNYVFYVDTVADAEGNHRVYPFVDGEPSEDMASLNDALRWMTVVVKHADGKVPASAVEEVDASLATPVGWKWSGAEVFCHLRDLPLHAAYQAWSMRSWPEFDLQSISSISPDEPAAARLGVVIEVEHVLRSRRLARRRKSAKMEEPHRILMDYLKDLTAAVIGERPPQIVVDVATGDDPKLAALAGAWLARFEAALVKAESNPVDDSQAALRASLGSALNKLLKDEAIELAEGARDLLIEDLTIAALDAGNSRSVLKNLRATMLSSDHVEEVYVSDMELESAFRAALGG